MATLGDSHRSKEVPKTIFRLRGQGGCIISVTKWFWLIWLMGRQKSGISMLSLQRMLEIKSYKTVWTMGHKIRKAMADRDAYYKLAGLIEMDDTYFGAHKPGKRGRGAVGKAKVVVAVETPKNKPRFAVMHMVPRVKRPGDSGPGKGASGGRSGGQNRRLTRI